MSTETTTETSLADLHARLAPVLDESPAPIKMWGVSLSADKDHFHTRLILQKFLRANKDNVGAAEKQFLETLEWRKEYFDAEGKVKGTWDEAKFGGLGWITKEKVGVDGDFDDVVVTWNIYGAVKDFDATFGDVDEFIRWRVTLMERTLDVLDLSSARIPIPNDGPDPYKAIQIHDYLNVSFLRSPPSVKAASKKAIELFQNYYPELLDKKYFVNVPVLMGWVFTAMKMLVARETLKKLEMISYGSYLAKEMGSDSVPVVYGGKGAPLSQAANSISPTGELVKPATVTEMLQRLEIRETSATPHEELAQGTEQGGGVAGVGDIENPNDAAASVGSGETAQPSDATPAVGETQTGSPPPVPVKGH